MTTKWDSDAFWSGQDFQTSARYSELGKTIDDSSTNELISKASSPTLDLELPTQLRTTS
jgi:hypothetical protein